MSPNSHLDSGAEDLWIQIVLFDLSRPRRISDAGVVWHPSQALEGYVLITARGKIDIDEIYISFEGVSWICTTSPSKRNNNIIASRSEQKFLTQKLELSPSAIERLETSRKRYGTGYRIPYHFIIPKYIIGTNPRIPEQCLVLPPSLIAGPTIENTASISYHLRVTAKLSVQGWTGKATLYANEPVTVISLVEELPPVETQDFPAEYMESASNRIRTSFVGTSLGMMTISTREPPALSYDLMASGCSTVLKFQVDLDVVDNGEVHRRLQAITFKVESVLRIKTFRSTSPFPKLPSQGLLVNGGKIRLSDQIMKLGRQSIGNIGWHPGPKKDGFSAQTKELFPSCSASAPALDPSNEYATSKQSVNVSEPSVAPRRKGTWRTNFDVPLHVVLRLTPTFCSPLIARFYSLILRLKVSKVFSKVFELEVPVQVIYLPAEPTLPSPDAATPRARCNHQARESNLETEEFLPMYNEH